MAAKRVYKKVKCFTSKAGATAHAKQMRKSGKTARVSGKCVLSAGARRKRK